MEKLTQVEVDESVDSHALMYVHARDVKAAFECLERRGATSQMLATSLTKVLGRDMNASGHVGLAKAGAAMYWLDKYDSSASISNFVLVASRATNSLAREAWHYVNKRTVDRRAVICEGAKLLSREDMPLLQSCVWDTLEGELNGQYRDLVVEVAHRSLGCGCLNSYRADDILYRTLPEYANSVRHREIADSLATDERFSLVAPAAYNRVRENVRLRRIK